MIIGHTFPVILLARVIQGIGSGVATPLMMNIILEQSPRSKVGRLMGVGSLVITVAPAIGPTVGGAVSSVLPWRAIFVIAIPIVLLVSPAARTALHRAETPHRGRAAQPSAVRGDSARPERHDLGAQPDGRRGQRCGQRLFGDTSRHHHRREPGRRCGLPGVLRLVIQPLVLAADSSGVATRPCRPASSTAYLILPIVGIGFGYVITNLAQMSLGTSAFHAGVLVLPGALVGAFFAPVGGMLYDKFGPTKPILSAISVATFGPILLLVFSMRLTPATLAGFYFIFGLGYALGFSNIMTSALSGIDHAFMPDGNAVFNTALQFGGAVGTALFSMILGVAQAGAGSAEKGSAAFRHATAVGGTWMFATMTVICLIAICSLACAFRIRASRTAAER